VEKEVRRGCIFDFSRISQEVRMTAMS